VCEASPVETVLYPVPVHFRGSGFYTTDYGRGKGAKKDAKESGDASGSSDSDKGGGKDGGKEKPSTEKKAAEA
jgi:predicted nucleic acid-binding Zn ribbon protein